MIKIEFEQVANALFSGNVRQENGSYKLHSGITVYSYWDFSKLKSHPFEKAVIVAAYMQMIQNQEFDLLADVPSAPGFLVSSISDRLLVPQITPRVPKDHGNIVNIEGDYRVGGRVVLLEDIFTTGNSAREAADILEKHELKVVGIWSIIDARENPVSTPCDYSFQSFTTNKRLLEYKSQKSEMSKTQS